MNLKPTPEQTVVFGLIFILLVLGVYSLFENTDTPEIKQINDTTVCIYYNTELTNGTVLQWRQKIENGKPETLFFDEIDTAFLSKYKITDNIKLIYLINKNDSLIKRYQR